MKSWLNTLGRELKTLSFKGVATRREFSVWLASLTVFLLFLAKSGFNRSILGIILYIRGHVAQGPTYESTNDALISLANSGALEDLMSLDRGGLLTVIAAVVMGTLLAVFLVDWWLSSIIFILVLPKTLEVYVRRLRALDKSIKLLWLLLLGPLGWIIVTALCINSDARKIIPKYY